MAFDTVPIENVQAYWDARPCNIRHSTRPVGSREYFDEVEQRKYRVEPHIPGFAEFPRWAGKKVLEIGCGIGTDTINFARAGAHVVAVDLSSESIAVAKQRAKVMGVLDRIEFVHSNAEHLDEVLAGCQFDLVYSFGVIHHSPFPEQILAAAHRLLVPGGQLRVMVYHRMSWKVLWIVTTQVRFGWKDANAAIATHSEAQTGCPVTYSYSRDSLTAVLKHNGFRPSRVWADHIFPYRIKDYVQYRYVTNWYWRILPNSVFRAFERQAGWHLMAVATKTEG